MDSGNKIEKKKLNRPLSKIATQYLECYYVKT